VHTMADIGENQLIWVFRMKIGVETRFGKITACPDMSTFFPKFRQKNYKFGHLEPIWDGFGHSKYLVIWALGRKNELWMAIDEYKYRKAST